MVILSEFEDNIYWPAVNESVSDLEKKAAEPEPEPEAEEDFDDIFS